MKRNYTWRNLVMTGIFALLTAVGISRGFASQSQAGDYKPLWSSQNAPEFYGTTRMVLQKGTEFALGDARMRTLAKDFEDGDLTSKIRVVANDVNTAEPGEYAVVYSVADSHGNITKQTVPVTVVDNDEGNYYEKTIYALPATNYMTITGTRANQMDKQVLGFMLAQGQSVEVKQVAGSAKLSLYSGSGALAAQKSAGAAWQTLTAADAASLMAETPVGAKAVVALRTDAEVAALPYYHYGDDEGGFRAYWTKLAAAGKTVGAVEGQSMLYYLTTNDKPAAWTGLAAGLANWDKLIDIYDGLLGYAYDATAAWNQNVRAKYFVRGAGNCKGSAVYSEGAVMLCGAGTASASGFKLNQAMAHALAHGYAGAGLTDAEMGVDAELAANLLVYYTDKKSPLAGKLAYTPEGELLNALITRLDSREYAEGYAAIAQMTREMNAKGTLAQHKLAERYDSVLGKVEDKPAEGDAEQPGEGDGGEDEQPGEDNNGEDEQPGDAGDENPSEGEQPGDGDQPSEANPTEDGYEKDKPSRDEFTVVAQAPNKGNTVQKPELATADDTDGGVLLTVVATTSGGGSKDPEVEGEPELHTLEVSNAANGSGDNGDAVTESVKEPENLGNTVNSGAKEISEEQKEEGGVNLPVYIVVASVIIVVAVGLVFMWVRQK